MIEANDDIELVTERQMRDVEQAQAQAKAIAEGREVHPAELEAQAAAELTSEAPVAMEVHATVQRPPPPPPDPDTAMRHLRISSVEVLVPVLLLLWIHHRRR